jgi:hypothetical protein
VETPAATDSAGFANMPQLSTVEFRKATVKGSPANLQKHEMLELANEEGLVAVPSAPNATKDGFNVCTYATSCPAPFTSRPPPQRVFRRAPGLNCFNPHWIPSSQR